MHLNSCLMIGRVSAKGPALRYAENGTACCSFVLEIDELSQGQVYTTYVPCEISGKYAEPSAEAIEPGDVLHISGKWKYKSVVDPKSGAKVSKPVVSSWGISQRQPGAHSEAPEYDSGSDHGALLTEAVEPLTRGKLKTHGPKWTPTPVN